VIGPLFHDCKSVCPFRGRFMRQGGPYFVFSMDDNLSDRLLVKSHPKTKTHSAPTRQPKHNLFSLMHHAELCFLRSER
jgi:hypothetical protein